MHDYRQNAFTGNMESSDKEDFNIVPKNQPHYVRLREVPLKEVPTTIAVRFLAFVTDANITAAATIINMDFDLSKPFKVGDVLTIDSEKVKISAISGGAVTVVRGYESLAVPHARVDTATPIIAYGPLLAEVATDPASGQYQPDYTTKPNGDETWNTGELRFNSADAHKWIQIKYAGIGTLSSAERSGNDPLRNYGMAIDKPIVAVLSGSYAVPLNLECQIFYARAGTTLTGVNAPGFLVRATGATVTCGTLNVSGYGGNARASITYGYALYYDGSENRQMHTAALYMYDDSNGGGSCSSPNNNQGGGIAWDSLQIIGGANQTLPVAARPLFARKNLICFGAAWRGNRGGGGATLLSPYVYLKGSYYANGAGGGGGGCFIFGAERITDDAALYQVNGGGAGWVLKLEQGGRT